MKDQKYCFVLVMLPLLFAIATQMTSAEEPVAKPIRVLLIDNPGPGYYHMPTAVTLRNILRENKQVEVVLVEDAEVL